MIDEKEERNEGDRLKREERHLIEKVREKGGIAKFINHSIPYVAKQRCLFCQLIKGNLVLKKRECMFSLLSCKM